MARQFLKFLIIPLMMVSTACTVAVPNISSLSEVTVFSNKSASPFDQDNVGGIIYFSGKCLPQVTGFEFRLNNFTFWSPVTATPPSPGSGEYLVGAPEYDVDCSDGDFNFYVFESTAMANFTLNAATSGPGDPSAIELRTIGIDNLPTIVFQRPPPSTFYIEKQQYDFGGYLEVEKTLKFYVRLVDTNGHNVIMPSGQIKTISITPTDLQSSSAPAGVIYKNDCVSTPLSTDFDFNPGDDELEFCYKATGTTIGNMIQLEVSAAGMLPSFQNIGIKPANSAVSRLATNLSGNLPAVLLKGVDYILKMSLNPLDFIPPSRYVSDFTGQLEISASDSNTYFVRSGSDSECPSTPQPGFMSCASTSYEKSFVLNVNPASTASNVTLNISATPQTSCSTCRIYDGGYLPISFYLPTSYNFNLVSGPSTYNQPYVNIQSSYQETLNLDQCYTADIGQANIDGVVIPATAMNYNISYSGSATMKFYYSSMDCYASGSYSPAASITFAVNEITRPLYFKVDSMPPNGIATLNINDGSNTFNKSYYIKSDSGNP